MMAEDSTLTPASKLPLKIAAIVAIVLGVLALISPFRAGIAATLVLAWSFLIGGCLGAYAAFKVRHWTGTYGLMLLSIVSILAGLFIFGNATKIYWGFRLRTGEGRWFIVLSGVLSVVVAGMLYWHFPFSAAWAFGVLVGVTLIFEGVSHLAFLHDKK